MLGLLSRSSADGVANLAGWLTTTVARVCLDMLRARKARREEPLPAQPASDGDRAGGVDPEQGGKISAIDVIADPQRLRELNLAGLSN